VRGTDAPIAAVARAPVEGDAGVVELARELIRAPSGNPPGDERAVARALSDAAHAFGLPPARCIARNATRPNLLTTIDFGPGGRHLVVSGHMDTKPVGDARWSGSTDSARPT
jgi:succinyl-diaminopimelate desuccinylase